MKFQKNKAVFFDFDGTLFFGTADLNTACFSHVRRAFGLEPIPPEAIHATIGMTPPEICRYLLGRDDPEALEKYGRIMTEHMLLYVRERVSPSADLTGMLRAVRERAHVAILSNADTAYMDAMLDALKIRSFFDTLWCYRPGYTKASAIPVLMEQLGVRAAIMVGDRLEDVEAGRGNHIGTVGMRNPVFPEETLQADVIVCDHVQLRQVLLQKLQS